MWRRIVHAAHFLPPELVHWLAIKAFRAGITPHYAPIKLPVNIAGLSFDNPLGLAAGFDKNAAIYEAMIRLGFGFAEVGTITPRPQPGNPRPRLFRLTEDKAIINRLGFNSDGMQIAAKHLSRRQAQRQGGIIGVNIGANKTTQDRPHDYYQTARHLGHLGDYISVNLSSPNTPGLRDLQQKKALQECLAAVFSGRDEGSGNIHTAPPVFVKLAPDLDSHALQAACEGALEAGVAGFILTNTTITRPDHLISKYRGEDGGLSGMPLAARARAVLAEFAGLLERQNIKDIALISVGGIHSAPEAYSRLLVGANLLQLYSALIFEGPEIVAQIVNKIAAMLAADGVADINDIVGAIPNPEVALAHAEHIARKAAS